MNPSDPPPVGTGFEPEELESLRESLAALREEIETRFGGRRRRSESTAGPARPGLLDGLACRIQDRVQQLQAGELFQGARRALSARRTVDRSAEIDEFGLDSLYLERARPLLDFLFDRWWRVRVIGAEHLPSEGRVLLVSNRSGILPYDGLMIAHAVERADAWRSRPRFLVADWIANLPFSQPILARLGGVRACPQNAERLLRAGHWVVAFPEGQKGALKVFRDRYQLQRFARGGFVSLALRLNATLVPVAVIGAEEAHPILAHPSLIRRLLGFPVPVTPTFPLLGPLGLVPLPSSWRIRFGRPLRWDPAARSRADDALYINQLRDRIRATIQALVDEEVHRRSGVFTG